MHPLFILSAVLQIACAIHVLRTGRPMYWIFLLLIGSYIAVAVYFFAEIMPGLGNSPTSRKALRSAHDRIDPDRHRRKAARQLDVADTSRNRQALAEESLRSGDFQKAEQLYRSALTGLYRTDPNLMLGLAQAQFGLQQPQQARDTLDALIAANPTFRSHEGHLLYARALEACGDIPKALEEYAAVVVGFPGEEARVRHAQLLKRAGQAAKARELLNESLKRADLAPAFYRREQRPWLDLAKRELQNTD